MQETPVPLRFLRFPATETGIQKCLEHLENVRPMTELVPLAQEARAYARMMEREARFRMVLVNGQ